MICLFFISGSTFNKQIPINEEYIKFLKSLGVDLFIVKKLDYLIIKEKYKKYKTHCENKFNNPIVGIMGISSGGYYANKLNNEIKNKFCILISPILDPLLRVKLTKKYSKQTPKVTKTKKVKNNTLVIIGKKDKKAPFEMYKNYIIKNLNILNNSNHSICSKPNTIIKSIIGDFLVKLLGTR